MTRAEKAYNVMRATACELERFDTRPEIVVHWPETFQQCDPEFRAAFEAGIAAALAPDPPRDSI